MELEPPSGNHYQLHCIRWTKTTSKDIVETKTWTIQYKIQWHNALFQRSSFTMTMTTSARGLKQSQCDRSFSKTKIYAMIDHEVTERCMQWHSKKVLLNVSEQVVSVADLIFKSCEYEDWMTVCITPSNWLFRSVICWNHWEKIENMKIWRLAASFNWVTGFWRAHTHSEWATLQYCQVHVLKICNCLRKEILFRNQMLLSLIIDF